MVPCVTSTRWVPYLHRTRRETPEKGALAEARKGCDFSRGFGIEAFFFCGKVNGVHITPCLAVNPPVRTGVA